MRFLLQFCSKIEDVSSITRDYLYRIQIGENADSGRLQATAYAALERCTSLILWMPVNGVLGEYCMKLVKPFRTSTEGPTDRLLCRGLALIQFCGLVLSTEIRRLQ